MEGIIEKLGTTVIDSEIVNLDTAPIERLTPLKEKLELRQLQIRDEIDEILIREEKLSEVKKSNHINLISLLNELNNVQSQLLKVLVAMFGRKASDTLQSVVNIRTSHVQELANKYKQQVDLADPAINEYNDSLNTLKNEYYTDEKIWLSLSSEFQCTEFDILTYIAKLENELADTESNIEKRNHIKTTISEKRKALSSCRESDRISQYFISECYDDFSSIVSSVSEDTDLAKVDSSQNVFAKIFIKIKDKIGRRENFNQNAIKPLQAKADNIKKTIIPKIQEERKNDVVLKLKKIYGE